MDFSGFTKTVILPQGEFDAFLRGDPKKRREVLSELLDVDVYQRMMRAANEKSKDAGIRAQERPANLDVDATPKVKVEHERRLVDLIEKEKTDSELCGQFRELLTDALTLREKRSSLAASQSELEEPGLKLVAAQEQARKAKGQVATRVRAIEELDRQIESTAYDGDWHLRLNSLLPQSQQQRKMREQLTLAEKKREAKNIDLATVGSLRRWLAKRKMPRRFMRSRRTECVVTWKPSLRIYEQSTDPRMQLNRSLKTSKAR